MAEEACGGGCDRQTPETMPECGQTCQTDLPVVAVQGRTVRVGVLLGGQLVPLVVSDGWCVEEVGHTVEKGLQEGTVPRVVTPGLLVTTTVGASVRFFLVCHVMALGLEDEDSIAAVNPVGALRSGEPAGCDAVCILYWVPNNGVLDGCAIALACGIMLEYLVKEPGVEALIDQARLNVGHLHIMGTEQFRVGGGVQ
jgi:hypothetical protein